MRWRRSSPGGRASTLPTGPSSSGSTTTSCPSICCSRTRLGAKGLRCSSLTVREVKQKNKSVSLLVSLLVSLSISQSINQKKIWREKTRDPRWKEAAACVMRVLFFPASFALPPFLPWTPYSRLGSGRDIKRGREGERAGRAVS